MMNNLFVVIKLHCFIKGTFFKKLEFADEKVRFFLYILA